MSITEGNPEPVRILQTAAPHPEEMKASIDLTIGKSVALKGSIRATPAGIVSAALLVAAILIPVVWLSTARRVGLK